MKVTRIRQVRNYASEAADPVYRPPKKPRLFRRFILYTSVFATGFYGGSAIVALNNDRYHDFFVESLPLGEALIDWIEQNGYDKSLRTPGAKRTVEVGQTAFGTLEGAVSRTFGSGTVPTNQAKVYGQPAPPGSVKEVAEQKKEQVREAAKAAIKKVDASVAQTPAPVKKAAETAAAGAIQFSEGVAELVSKAEAALGKTVPEVVQKAKDAVAAVEEAAEPWTPPPGMQVWTGPPLPLGHSLPPGYVYPPPPKKKKSKKKAAEDVPPLPLVAPAVAEIAGSEPVIAQLAGTIDQLTTFLNKNPSKGNVAAKDVLSTAENDLKQLADRFELIKSEEQKKLGLQLEDQAREYNVRLLELEVAAQDKIDKQEEDWKSLFDEERENLRELYRRKLETELVTQSEIINERLKEEVIAQGIELQRRWIRDIKVKVEEERGGRLAKLDSLASDVKRLERVTLDNNAYLDENISIHSLWSAIRALTQVISEAGSRKSFREELRTLHSVATNRGDSLVLAALETLDSSDVPDIGVDPLQDLITWFSSSVAPKIESVALVPDQNAGVLSHVASAILSKFRFKRTGLVGGSDVPSVLARAEYYLTQKDLDSAARELNQLTGWPKLLASDWLSAARKRLEVTQALEIIQTHATLSSLLVLDTKQ